MEEEKRDTSVELHRVRKEFEFFEKFEKKRKRGAGLLLFVIWYFSTLIYFVGYQVICYNINYLVLSGFCL